MDDMNTFEGQVAGELLRRAGPVRPVDDLVMFDHVVATTQSPRWRFRHMFSPTKFVVAGVIVALASGFLLAGVLAPQRDASEPFAGATSTASTAAPVTSIQAKLLPGVELVTQRLAPTVYRVLDDGAGRDLSHIWDVASTAQGVVWVHTAEENARRPRVFQLGVPGSFTPADGLPEGIARMSVGADDRLYVRAFVPQGKVALDDRAVLTEDGWRAPTAKEWAEAGRPGEHSKPSGIVAADGSTWEFGYGPDAVGVPRHIVHQGPDGRTEYRLMDMGFEWGDKRPKETGVHRIRPAWLAAAPDGRVWAAWRQPDGRGGGVALAEFDGSTWSDITPIEWRVARVPPREDPSFGIRGVDLAVAPDGTLRATADVWDYGLSGLKDTNGYFPTARIEASWDGERWLPQSRTSWDLASVPTTPASIVFIWLASIMDDDTMVLQAGFEGQDTRLYILQPEIDATLTGESPMAP